MDSDDEGPPMFSMFESSIEKVEVSIELGGYEITLNCIHDDPGALQSGHFLWPGSKIMGEYLCDEYKESEKNVKKIGIEVLDLIEF